MEFLIQLLNGIQYGLLLFMLASGLTLIFGIMGVINMAHDSFYMIGAYLAPRMGQAAGLRDAQGEGLFVSNGMDAPTLTGIRCAKVELRINHLN